MTVIDHVPERLDPMPEPDVLPSLEWFMTEIPVDDWPGAVRWYVEALGFRLTLRDEVHGFALLEAGGGRLALKRNETANAEAKADADAGANASRARVRLVFRVDDLDAARKSLIARGVAVSEPVENVREAYREARLVDPEGTPITLFQWTVPDR